MNLYVLMVSVVIVICLFFSKLSNKFGIPTLLVFIGVGILFGEDGIFKVYFNNYDIAEDICTIALLFIMFYGGFCTNWKIARPVIGPAIIMSTIGTVLTALIMGLFCFYVLKVNMLTGLLIGSILSSTDAASVFSILRLHKLNLKGGLASLLEIESGSNDPFAYILIMLTLSLMGVVKSSVPLLLFKQLGSGICFGLIIGLIGVYILKKINFRKDELDSVFVFAIALISYALPVYIGGNGYLSVYICGLILGNSEIKNKTSLVPFFSGITNLAQIIIFFLLGLLSSIHKIPDIFAFSVFISLFLTFVARPVVSYILLKPFKMDLKKIFFVSAAGLRGAASIVFAIIVIAYDVNINMDIYHIVFLTAIFSILIQGTFLPFFARKLNIVDSNEDVFKTFNDYKEDNDLQLVQIKVTKDTGFINKRLCDVRLASKILIVMIKRGNKFITPNGDTIIKEGDILIFNARLYKEEDGVKLKEVNAFEHKEWIDKSVSDIVFKNKRRLIVMIKRGENMIIPKGDTIIEKNDVLILSGFE